MTKSFKLYHLINSLLFFLFLLPMSAQEKSTYYYYKGDKIPLQLDTKTIFISALDSKTVSNVESGNSGLFSKKSSEVHVDNSSTIVKAPKNAKGVKKTRYWRQMHFSGNSISKEEYYEKINQLRKLNKNLIISPYFKKTSEDNIGLSNYFYIKLKHKRDLPFLQSLVKKYNLELVGQNEFMPLWFTISITPNSEGVLTMANTLYETGKFEDIDPAFMFNFRKNCRNDSNFSQLWGLNNASNPSIDINACAAWGITEGNGINVAVLDQGVHKTHNDLSANISPLSFNAQSGTSPSIFTNGRNHGTHVAGTIAAVADNNLQVTGVSPKSKIISVSHTLALVPNVSQQLANGINWSWQNGAHIINNSWGDQGGAYYNQLRSALLENAITNALSMGRSGLGTVVVFSSGNFSPAIDYPASYHDNILCIGSITSTGTKSSFSGFGNDLDVVAPGSGILSTIPNNGTASWNGTSMAAPHVSGVAALVLSVNPSLSAVQVNNIIEQTAQKVRTDLYNYSTTSGRPNGSWNNQLGYGLVDAHAAVVLSQSMATPPIENNTFSFNGSSTLVGSTPTGGTGNYTYQWRATCECSNNSYYYFEPIPGATGKNYTIPQAILNSPDRHKVYYTRTVFSGSQTSISPEHTILGPLANNTITFNGSMMAGSLPTGGIGTYTYEWRVSNFIVHNEIVPNATGRHLTVHPSVINNPFVNEHYKRIVKSGFETIETGWVATCTNCRSGREGNDSDTRLHINAATSMLHVETEYSESLDAIITLTAYDNLRELIVYQGRIPSGKNVLEISLPFSPSKGLYFYTIKTKNNKKSGKFILKN